MAFLWVEVTHAEGVGRFGWRPWRLRTEKIVTGGRRLYKSVLRRATVYVDVLGLNPEVLSRLLKFQSFCDWDHFSWRPPWSESAGHVVVCRRFRKIARSNYKRRYVCRCVCRHGQTRLQLDEFSWNFIFEYFSKTFRKTQVSLKHDKKNGSLHEHPCSFITHRWILLRRGSVLDKSCGENQNTFYVQ